MNKTQKAIQVIDAAMAAGKTHIEAAREAERQTGLAVFSEGPAGSMGEGARYVASLPRGTRRSLFDIHVRNGQKFGRMLARHFAGPKHEDR